MKSTGPEWKFSQEPKLKSDFKSGPGPGEYSIRESSPSSKGAVFGTSEREPLSKPLDTPGAGTYEIKGMPEGPKYTIQGKHQEYIKDFNPAPNAYNQEITDFVGREKSPSYKFGLDSRFKETLNENPAPTEYNVELRSSGPMWKFNQEARDRPAFNENTPAPNAYNIEFGDINKGEKSPAYRFGSESKSKEIKNDNPSPGHYNIDLKSTSPEWKFGTEKKDKYKTAAEPGPADYSPRELSPSSKAAFFGTSSRPPLSLAPETPGVGTY